MPPSYCPQSRRAVYPPRVLALIFLCRPPHVCNMFPVCPPHMIYPNDTVQSIWLSKWVQMFSVVSPFFFFLPELYIPSRGTLCDLWVSLTQPPRKRVSSKGANFESSCCVCFLTTGISGVFSSSIFFFFCHTWWYLENCSVMLCRRQMVTTHSNKGWHPVFKRLTLVDLSINSQLVAAVSCVEGNVDKVYSQILFTNLQLS